MTQQPVYAIGDVHGHLEALKIAHRRIFHDGGAEARIIHLGDLIDKGPQAKGVIDHLMEGQAQGRNWRAIKGNHDNKLPRFIEDPLWVDPGSRKGKAWLEDPGNGAEGTLRSYGIRDPLGRNMRKVHEEALRRIPRAHIDWLDRLPLWELDPRGFLFVHAGIRPGVDLLAQDPVDLMWIRKPFHDYREDHGVLVVHGHTPGRRVRHYGNRINLDTNAAAGGSVSAVRLDHRGAFLLTGDGPLAIHPGEKR